MITSEIRVPIYINTNIRMINDIMPATVTVTPIMRMIKPTHHSCLSFRSSGMNKDTNKMMRPLNNSALNFPAKIPTQTTITSKTHHHRQPLVCSVSPQTPPIPSEPPLDLDDPVGFLGELFNFFVERNGELKDAVISVVFADNDGLIQEKLAKIFPKGLVKPLECGPIDEEEWKLLLEIVDLVLDNMDRCVKTRATETVGFFQASRNTRHFLKTQDAWREQIGTDGKCIEFHFRVSSHPQRVLDDDKKVSDDNGVAEFLQKLKSSTDMSITALLETTTWVARGGGVGEDVTRGV